MAERVVVDLSHRIADGMVTYPGLPGPVVGAHLTREASRTHYEPGTEFHIGSISMVGNTGTYLDTPYHRFADGYDLAGLPVEDCYRLPGVLFEADDRQAIGPSVFAGANLRGRAVLIRTGWDRHFGTDAYGGADHPFVTGPGARALVEAGARLVGIDSVNIDDVSNGSRPAHSALLAAGVPILEHLTNLDRLPVRGFTVTALPPRVVGLGTFPVRAVAEVNGPN
jgi:kynurenine formamidase